MTYTTQLYVEYKEIDFLVTLDNEQGLYEMTSVSLGNEDILDMLSQEAMEGIRDLALEKVGR